MRVSADPAGMQKYSGYTDVYESRTVTNSNGQHHLICPDGDFWWGTPRKKSPKTTRNYGSRP